MLDVSAGRRVDQSEPPSSHIPVAGHDPEDVRTPVVVEVAETNLLQASTRHHRRVRGEWPEAPVCNLPDDARRRVKQVSLPVVVQIDQREISDGPSLVLSKSQRDVPAQETRSWLPAFDTMSVRASPSMSPKSRSVIAVP